MHKRKKIIKKLIFLSAIVIALSVSLLFYFKNNNETIKIGILLDLTGPNSADPDEILDWSLKRINAQGGINGHLIEFIRKDTNKRDIKELALELLKDKSIKIVIGPSTSVDLFKIATMFIKHHKILISPMASSGDIYRAFYGNKFIWRTVQGDQVQANVIIHILAKKGVKKIALMTENTTYGKTFFDWIGFFATESGIEVINNHKFLPGSNNFLKRVLRVTQGDPEYLIAAAFPEDALKIKKALDEIGSKTKLLLTDASENQLLIKELGEKSEGIELISPGTLPNNEFEETYKEDFGYYPWDTASHIYDSLLLAIYTLTRQEYLKSKITLHTEKIEDSLCNIIYKKQGDKISWNKSHKAIQLILEGKFPNIEGASSSLNFDKQSNVEPLETIYEFQRIETKNNSRDFYTIEKINSTIFKKSSFFPSETKNDNNILTSLGNNIFKEKKDLWAVIIATTDGWENYRHQSDACAFYDLLKKNEVEDSHIIFFTADDIPWLKNNPIKGDIHHEIKGKNLRENAFIDYSGSKVTAENLENVLLGKKTLDTPVTLDSNDKSNVFIYIVGHGSDDGSILKEQLTSKKFSNIIEEMHANKKFNKMLIIVETCFGEKLGLSIKTPDVLFFTGASKQEVSFGVTYDYSIDQWIADDFSKNILDVLRENPNVTIEELYKNTHQKTFGSHTKLLNYENFKQLNTPMTEFISSKCLKERRKNP